MLSINLQSLYLSNIFVRIICFFLPNDQKKKNSTLNISSSQLSLHNGYLLLSTCRKVLRAAFTRIKAALNQKTAASRDSKIIRKNSVQLGNEKTVTISSQK